MSLILGFSCFCIFEGWLDFANFIFFIESLFSQLSNEPILAGIGRGVLPGYSFLWPLSSHHFTPNYLKLSQWKLLKMAQSKNFSLQKKNHNFPSLCNFLHYLVLQKYTSHIFPWKPVQLPLKRAYFDQNWERGWSRASNFVMKGFKKWRKIGCTNCFMKSYGVSHDVKCLFDQTVISINHKKTI